MVGSSMAPMPPQAVCHYSPNQQFITLHNKARWVLGIFGVQHVLQALPREALDEGFATQLSHNNVAMLDGQSLADDEDVIFEDTHADHAVADHAH